MYRADKRAKVPFLTFQHVAKIEKFGHFLTIFFKFETY